MCIYKIRVKIIPGKPSSEGHTFGHSKGVTAHSSPQVSLFLTSLSIFPGWSSASSCPKAPEKLTEGNVWEAGKKRRVQHHSTFQCPGDLSCGWEPEQSTVCLPFAPDTCISPLSVSVQRSNAHRATQGECPLPLSLGLGWADKSGFNELPAYTSQWNSIVDSRTLWRRDQGLLCPCMRADLCRKGK